MESLGYFHVWVIVGFTLSVILFILFLEHHASKKVLSQEPLENTFRIWLVIAILIVFPILTFFLSVIKMGGGLKSYYINILHNLTSGSIGVQILSLLQTLPLHIAGIGIPIMFIFRLKWLGRHFLHPGYQEISLKRVEENNTFTRIYHLFSQAVETGRVEHKFKISMLEPNAEETLPGFSGCGIIRVNKTIVLLLSKRLINLFAEGKISESELNSIFLHEISHIIHNDHLLPLWIRQLAHSRFFFWYVVNFSLNFFFFFIAQATQSGYFFQAAWRHFLIPVLLISLAALLIRMIVWHMLGHIMREREYLADARAYYIHGSSQDIVTAITNTSLWAPSKNSFSSSLAFAHPKSSHSKSPLSFLDSLLHFLDTKVTWHPSPSKRIKAIKEEKFSPSRLQGQILSTDIVAISAFLLTMMWVFAIGLVKIFDPTAFSIVAGTTAMVIGVFLIVLYCIPLRFLDHETLCDRFVGPYSSSAKYTLSHLPSRMVFSKDWHRIHKNNLFVFIFMASLIFPFNNMVGLMLIPIIIVACLGLPVLVITVILGGREKAAGIARKSSNFGKE